CELRITGPEESANVIRGVFSGVRGAAADMVLANAAAGLLVLGAVPSIAAGVERAREAVVSGAAEAQLQRLIVWTRNAAAKRAV
ncbi:MAG TPA: anthranilate phosphoribosyltransferase, partial [Planctomycetaceae bacterium]|nr:anthranilate phosphoribosyltransferase [Planctomycetaceae bacterium]